MALLSSWYMSLEVYHEADKPLVLDCGVEASDFFSPGTNLLQMDSSISKVGKLS